MRTFRRVLLSLSLSAYLATGAQAQALQTDDWYHLVRKGVAFGSLHRVVSVAGGRLTARLRYRVLMDFLGTRQEIRIDQQLVASADGRPVSMRYAATYAVKQTEHTGRLEGTQLVFRRAGQAVGRLELGADLVFDELIGEAARARGLAVGGSLPLRLLDCEALTAARTTVTRAARPGGSLLQLARNGTPIQTLELDARGRLIAIDDRITRMRLQRVAPADADKITHLQTDDGYTLTVVAKRPYANPSEVLEAVVRIGWRESPGVPLHLTDSRQALVERVRDARSGRTLARLQLTRRPPPESALRVPVQRPELAPFLGTTRYIRPAHPQIVKAARRLVGEERQALAIVRALSAFVGRKVETAMIAETLTGPEVLAQGKGKCSEVAVLFASLARAAGIPTRLALGVRYSDGRWIGHLWNEVWLDRWIPVDAGADEVGTSGPMLIKLVHGPSVESTQAVRWALVDNFTVEIIDVKARASALAGRYTAGIAGRTFTSLAYRCRMTAPSDGWTVAQGPGGSTLFARKALGNAKVYLSLFAAPAGYDARRLLEIRHATHFAPKIKGYTPLATGPMRWGGKPAHGVRVRGEIRKGEPTVLREILMIDGRNAYLLTCYVAADAWDAFKPELERLAASFELLK